MFLLEPLPKDSPDCLPGIAAAYKGSVIDGQMHMEAIRGSLSLSFEAQSPFKKGLRKQIFNKALINI